MRRSYLALFALLGSLLLLGACTANPVPEDPEPKDAFVFGHIDMEDAPVGLGWLTIRQFSPKVEEPYYYAGTDSGTFFSWYLDTPGAFAIVNFGGSGYRTRYTFNVPRQVKDFRFKIKNPGVYYLGSFKYKEVETGFFEGGKFQLEQVKSPTEKELLVKLIELTKGTVVEPKLQARLKELK